MAQGFKAKQGKNNHGKRTMVERKTKPSLNKFKYLKD